MPYAPMKVTTEPCANGCPGRQFVLELRGPGQCGLSQEMWDNKPEGCAAYYCERCQLVYFRKRRGTKINTLVGFWDKQTHFFNQYTCCAPLG